MVALITLAVELSRDGLLAILFYLAIVVGSVWFLFWLLDQMDPEWARTRRILKVVIGIIGALLVVALLLNLLGLNPWS